jgi:hypothetical protein
MQRVFSIGRSVLLMLLVLLTVTGCGGVADHGRVVLFNGRDTSGWRPCFSRGGKRGRESFLTAFFALRVQCLHAQTTT